MKLEIQKVWEAGVLKSERVVLRASAEVDIGRYAIFCADISDDGEGVESGKVAAYWFPDKTIHSGDLLVLYSKTGEESEKVLSTGGKSHFYYWGMEESQWTKTKAPVLVETSSWKMMPRSKSK